MKGNVSSIAVYPEEEQTVKETKTFPHTQPGVLPGPPSSSQLTKKQQQLIGVARWPEPRHNRESNPSQRLYGLSFWQTSLTASLGITDGSLKSFNDVWLQATNWRCSTLGTHQREFKWKRTSVSKDSSITAMEGARAYIRTRFQNQKAPQTQDMGVLYGKFSEFPLNATLNGRKITLSTATLHRNPKANRNKPPFSPLRSALYSQPFYILHTNPTLIPEIMDHIEMMYQYIIKPETPTSHSLHMLADIHWWAANAVPDTRGNAEKTEFAVRAIALAKGIELGPLKRGIIADLEAMTTPRKDFIKNYESMFEQPDLANAH